MSGDTGLLAHVRRAEEYVGDARRTWDPRNASACAECVEALHLAVAEMEAACAVAAAGPVVDGVARRIEQLRSEVDQFPRLVDAAMAFCRGLPMMAEAEELASTELKV